MDSRDFMQGVMAIKGLIGSIQVPADEAHLHIVGQIHAILNGMRDECQNCMHQEMLDKRTEQANKQAEDAGKSAK